MMARELAYVLINPYTTAKSRTGGVIARFIGRTDLNVVAARMFGPCKELVAEYADLVRNVKSDRPETSHLISDYILRNYAPDPNTGRPRRVMMLVFEGDNAVEKMWKVTGSSTLRTGSGETVRDTYGDYIVDAQGKVQYFEPAVLVAPSRKRAAATLSLWARYSEQDGGIIDNAIDVPERDGSEKTLVLLKPDNFRVPSSRPGNIIDLLSLSNLRIVAVKKICMTVSEAEQFYAPVRESLAIKFSQSGAPRAARALRNEFGFAVPPAALNALCNQLGPMFAQGQFENIVQFMTGYKPSDCSKAEKQVLGKENCIALVYAGEDAVGRIRSILGTTDPNAARPGSVRREFGSNVMVNAAHASDSPENAVREMNIIRMEEETIKAWVDRYYGNVVSRIAAIGASLPRTKCEIVQRMRQRWKTKALSTAE
jgi:nucleoside diphosphate kinase